MVRVLNIQIFVSHFSSFPFLILSYVYKDSLEGNLLPDRGPVLVQGRWTEIVIVDRPAFEGNTRRKESTDYQPGILPTSFRIKKIDLESMRQRLTR